MLLLVQPYTIQVPHVAPSKFYLPDEVMRSCSMPKVHFPHITPCTPFPHFPMLSTFQTRDRLILIPIISSHVG